MKITAKRPLRDEKGQTMILVLVLLLIGIIIITPVLRFMGTGMTSGRVYEQKIDEIYAADAGVEDALWHIRYDCVEDLLGEYYDEYEYFTNYPYPDDYDLNVNGKDVAVNITNIWIPKDIDIPDKDEARQIIKDEKLLIIGYPSSEELTYEIKIVYYWETTAYRDALRVETIGLWLSPGFQYVVGSSDLVGYSSEDISLYKGGSAVVWEFESKPLIDFTPPENADDSVSPMLRTLTFKYTGPEDQLPELVSSWIVTTDDIPGTDYNYTWDDSIRLYKIMSKAGGIQVEAYGAKTRFRKLKSTISSDYTVAGNRLSEATGWGSDSYYRNKLYAETSSSIESIALPFIDPEEGVPPGRIPQDAMVEDVYLYWSGWIDCHYRCGDEDKSECEIEELKYPEDDPSYENLRNLIESANVTKVKFGVRNETDPQTNYEKITADKWQVVNTWVGEPEAWAYSCFADITDLVIAGGMTVQEYIEEAMKYVDSEVTFTLGHTDEVRGEKRPNPDEPGTYYDTYYFDLDGDGATGYPLATPAHRYWSYDYWWGWGWWYPTRYQFSYCGWSLIVFYRSPAITQRQLYLFDDFLYVAGGVYGYTEVPFTISGFLAPPNISDIKNSHVTYFVGEGDPHYDSQMKVNNDFMSGPGNPQDNVFNSYSNALPTTDTDGIDIDTFVLPDGCIMPYDTKATITFITPMEMYTLVYLVVSFSSDLTTGGIITNYSVTPSG